MEEIQLEVMDWKKIENSTENRIREIMVELMLHTEARALAKQNIIKLGGKTSEEEKKENLEQIEKNINTSIG